MFQKLAECYARLQKAYNKVVEVMSSGKRMLGKYFRVAFFGQVSEALTTGGVKTYLLWHSEYILTIT